MVSPIKNSAGEIIEININDFSTVEGYLSYGEKTGHDFNKINEFCTLVKNYATNTGEIEHYEHYGEVSSSFESWFNQQVVQYFGNNNPTEGSFTVYKDISSLNPSWTFLLGQALFMPPGWNNTVSKFYSLHIYGSTLFYDKTFYRNRMATFTDFGWKYWYFQGPLNYLNDKTSSCMDVGI